jgi:hypothetical protein
MRAAFSLSDASSCVSVMSSSKHLKLQDDAVCPNRCLSLPIQNKEFECIWRLYVYMLVIKSCDLYFFWQIFYHWNSWQEWNNIWQCSVSNIFYTFMPTMKYCNYMTLKERLFWMMQSILDLSQPFYFVRFEVSGFYMFWIVTLKNYQNSVRVR